MTLTKINRDEALSFLGYHGTKPDDNILFLFDKYEEQLLKVISPRYIYKVFDKNIPILIGKDIAAHLENSDKAVVLAATIGIQPDNLLKTVQITDMTGAVVLDSLMSSAIESVCDIAEKEISALFPKGKTTPRFSPGYGDFPLEVQPELIKLLDAQKKLGLYVNDGGLIIPSKSVTAVVGVRGI